MSHTFSYNNFCSCLRDISASWWRILHLLLTGQNNNILIFWQTSKNRLLRLPKELPVWLQGKQHLNSPMSFFTFTWAHSPGIWSITQVSCNTVLCQNAKRLIKHTTSRLIGHFNKLGWLPIDDIIRIRKLLMLHKMSQDHCSKYVMPYFKRVQSTRSASHNNILTPLCKNNWQDFWLMT